MQAGDHFKSRFGFLMAATGFAVGLGNIWRFPYITGENGGGAFVAVYLICAVGIGIPILMAEILLGRRGGGSPPITMRELAAEEDANPAWIGAGYLNIATAFLILATYSAVAGWVLWYLAKAVMTGFAGFDAIQAGAEFSSVTADIPGMLLWTVVILLIAGGIVYMGVNDGIERSVRFLMPTLFGLIVTLVIYNMFAGGFDTAVAYLFTPDFSKVSGPMILAAVGQAFFSIGVAMAGMMTFGAYLPKDISITRSAFVIIVVDTSVALLAGLMIFPMVFRFGMDPASGTGLIFQTLPVAFAQMPGGQFIAILFFLLLSVAAITSIVGLFEPLVAWLDEHMGWSRHLSTIVVTGAIMVMGLVSILSYTVIADWRIGSLDLNGILDFLSNQVMLPLGGLLIALFAGWVVKKADLLDELALDDGPFFKVWQFLIRFLCPAAIAVILVNGLF